MDDFFTFKMAISETIRTKIQIVSFRSFYVKYIRHLSVACFQHGYKGNWFYRGTPMQKNPINPAPVLCRVLANSGHLFCQYEDLIDLSG